MKLKKNDLISLQFTYQQQKAADPKIRKKTAAWFCSMTSSYSLCVCCKNSDVKTFINLPQQPAYTGTIFQRNETAIIAIAQNQV